MKKGVIQNDNLLYEVLSNEGEFFIPCVNSKDAQSKLVSLSNARRRMSVGQQEKVKVQKVQIEGVYGVKISHATKAQVFQIVDGKLVKWEKAEELSEEAKRIVDLMRKDGVSEEEISNFIKVSKGGI